MKSRQLYAVTSDAEPSRASKLTLVRGRRIKARVPAVLGEDRTSWALLCESLGHSGLPAVGAPVWIQFECGDPAYPVLMGVIRGETQGSENKSK